MVSPERVAGAILTSARTVLEVTAPDRFEALVVLLEAAGRRVVWVDRAPVFDKTSLLHALYQSLQLPAWFGFNWDALSDALGALDVDDPRPVILLFRHFSSLADHDSDCAATFLEVVEQATAISGAPLERVVLLGANAS